MHTVPLSATLRQPTHDIERGKEAAIAGEIAAHLLEYRDEVSASRAISFLQKLVAISHLNKDALWLFLSLLTGDMSAITRSYADQGRAEGLDKQAVQQRTERAIAVLQIHYPEAARAIVQLRHITAEIKR